MFLTTALFALTLLLSSADLFAQPGRRVDPRHSSFGVFNVVGDWRTPFLPGLGTYGDRIHAIRDCNSDGISDWVLVEHDLDTLIEEGIRRYPQKLRLYYGNAEGFPMRERGVFIGAPERASDTYFLADGDFNGDGNLDLLCRVDIYFDTSVNRGDRSIVGRPVIFWGNGEGLYSNNDTTRLSGGGVIDFAFRLAGVWDANADGVEDIVLLFNMEKTIDSAGTQIPTARIQVWYGRPRSVWEDPATPHTADLLWWNAPPGLPRRYGTDIDCDGLSDLVLFGNETGNGWYGSVSFLYGEAPGVVPDTNDVITVSLKGVQGKSTKLIDITNDHIVDFVVLSDRFSQQRIRAYPGEPGKRIHELISDLPVESLVDSFEWKEPWALIPGPNALHDGWGDLGNLLYDGGDANLDGYRDLWAATDPFVVAYGTNIYFDSLIDGLIQLNGAVVENIVDIGYVDGSGHSTTAVEIGWGSSGTSILFLQGHDRIPYAGKLRLFPHEIDEVRCDSPAGVETTHGPGSTTGDPGLELQVFHGADGAEIHWSGEGLTGQETVEIRVYDMIGRLLYQNNVLAGARECAVTGLSTMQRPALLVLRVGGKTFSQLLK